MVGVVETVVSGAVGGALFGLVGYLKASQTDNAEFDAKKIAVTVLSAAIVGGVAGYTGLANSEVDSATFGVVISQVLQKLYDTGKAKLK